jgi:hypothetical protein
MWLMNRRWQKKPVLATDTAAPAITSKASKKIAAPADKPAPSSKASKPIKAAANDNGEDKSED